MRLPRILRRPRRQSPSDEKNISEADGPQLQSSDEESETVILNFEDTIKEFHLREASQMLIQREERLFGEITEDEASTRHQEEINKLAADYNKLTELVMYVIRDSISFKEIDTESLSSAVKAIYQEEEQDQQWRQRDRTPPAWRPCSWKALHDKKLGGIVRGRMEPSSMPTPELDQSSIQAEINFVGRQLKEDLQWVVDVVRTCYPPQAHICNLYARLYHQSFSDRLRNIANFGLVDKDCTFLLRWTNEFYPGILQNPELSKEIDTESLEKLLPAKLLEPLEEQYLSKHQSELETYTGRVLDEAERRWNNGGEPHKEDGCYTSPVAYDIIQLVHGAVTSAEKVVGDLQKAQSITGQLSGVMQRFKRFQDNIIRQKRAHRKAHVLANLGCTQQFSEVFVRRNHLLPEDEREKCLRILAETKQSAQTYLLRSVHDDLKPQYRKLGTSDWLNKPVFEDLMVSIETVVQDLQGASKSCHEELLCQFYEDVTVEYVRRLLKGDKLKDKERQQQAYATVTDNAESLHNLFSRMGLNEDQLREILTKIAEVLKLQDLPAIQMQVVSLGSVFPDFSEKHVSALLKLKTNLSRADRRTVKETLADALRETSVENARPFFSKVQVK